jgi:hypothetical protein
VFEAPDDAGCPEVDAAVASLATIEGVRSPKPIMPEIIECIGGNFGDRRFRRIRIPGQIAQWDMARMIYHGALLRWSAANPANNTLLARPSDRR